MTDEQLTPEQQLVQVATRAGLELAANVPDIAERDRIWREVGQAFTRAVANAEARQRELAASGELEVEVEGQIVGTVHPITPGSHRWAPAARNESRTIR